MVIVVHGGAGEWLEDSDCGTVEGSRDGCARAARAGWDVLVSGGGAIDAVEAAVVVLEEDPTFNAGRGACLTRDRTIELDAAIMEGETLRIGAVGAVPPVRSAVRLARRVLDAAEEVFLVGAGAIAFAREHGVEACTVDELVTDRARRQWESGRWSMGMGEREGNGPAKPAATTEAGADADAKGGTRRGADTRGGTVGAVALDGRGHVAAATSTGGRLGKRSGRVGDSPLAGAGTYADDRLGAVSATGHGETIIRTVLGFHALSLVASGSSAQAAADAAIRSMEVRTSGLGGLILLAPNGDVGVAFTTRRMPYAIARRDGIEIGA